MAWWLRLRQRTRNQEVVNLNPNKVVYWNVSKAICYIEQRNKSSQGDKTYKKMK
jgi:hypothetical protein